MDTNNIFFDPANMFGRQAAKRQRYQYAVANAGNLPHGAASAVIVNGPHTSVSDRRQHITTDIYDAGNNFIRRIHVPCPP